MMFKWGFGILTFFTVLLGTPFTRAESNRSVERAWDLLHMLDQTLGPKQPFELEQLSNGILRITLDRRSQCDHGFYTILCDFKKDRKEYVYDFVSYAIYEDKPSGEVIFYSDVNVFHKTNLPLVETLVKAKKVSWSQFIAVDAIANRLGLATRLVTRGKREDAQTTVNEIRDVCNIMPAATSSKPAAKPSQAR